ncbi:MAG: ABC transporter substrate-binding protein, partial [Armatimonadetes bacterium]|nr:ABC transporter substrate-binding protein [Armatimonadota bacterium]
MRKILLYALAIVILPWSIASAGPRTLKVGIDDWPGYYAANQFTEPKGLKIEPVMVTDINERWQKLAGGNLDLAGCTLDAFTLGAARHNPGALLFKIDTSFGSDAIVAKKSIKTINEMAGKRVTYTEGMPSHYLLAFFLNIIGKSTADVKTMPVRDVKDAYENLISGKADVAVLWEPHVTNAVRQGNHILISSRNADLIEDICVANFKVLKDRKADIQLFVNAWFSVIKLLSQNPGMARKLISQRSGIPSKDLDDAFPGIKFASHEENKKWKARAVANMKQAQQVWVFEGLQNAGNPIVFGGVTHFWYLDSARPESGPGLFGNVKFSVNKNVIGQQEKEKKLSVKEIQGKTEELARLKFKTIHFATASATIAPDSQKVIEYLAGVLNRF